MFWLATEVALLTFKVPAETVTADALYHGWPVENPVPEVAPEMP